MFSVQNCIHLKTGAGRGEGGAGKNGVHKRPRQVTIFFQYEICAKRFCL